jgi:hypothetical protein
MEAEDEGEEGLLGSLYKKMVAVVTLSWNPVSYTASFQPCS